MIEILLLFAFFGLLFVLANVTERARRGAAETQTVYILLLYGSVVLVHTALFVGGIGAQLFGRLQANELLPEGADLQLLIGADASAFNWNLIGAGLWLPALIGLLVLLPPVRTALGRILPIEPQNHVHAVALSLATLSVPNLTVTLGVGLENLAGALAGTTDAVVLIGTIWLQNLAFVLISLLGVGLFVTRDGRAALERLAIRRLTLREAGIAAGVGVLLLVAIVALTALGDAMGLGSPEVEALSEALYGPFMRSLPGILTVALAAPIGEETLFRGAAQPRFGRVLTALLFTIVHGNYGLSVITLGLFGVGYVLGIVRERYNTTAAMITHGTFNGIQALIAFAALQFGVGI